MREGGAAAFFFAPVAPTAGPYLPPLPWERGQG
jgi:hypothetical protein